MTSTALPHVREIGEERTQAAEPSAIGFRITAESLRVWGIRSALSVFDQGLTAAVGFGVNIALARWLSADAYGAFAVAFATFLFISGFHNVLLLEPLTVMGPSRHPNRLPTYFREQIVIHVILVGVLAAVILLAAQASLLGASGHPPFAGAFIGSGGGLPFLALFLLVRRMCYVLPRPAIPLLRRGFLVL